MREIVCIFFSFVQNGPSLLIKVSIDKVIHIHRRYLHKKSWTELKVGCLPGLISVTYRIICKIKHIGHPFCSLRLSIFSDLFIYCGT